MLWYNLYLQIVDFVSSWSALNSSTLQRRMGECVRD